MNNPATGVAILGGTGFGAGELLRLLAFHPYTSVVSVVSSTLEGAPIHTAHPHLRSIYPQNFDAEIQYEALQAFPNQVVFSALPHGESGKKIAELRQKLPSAIFIDLSGDFRLKDETVHAAHYPYSPFLPELRAESVYGLTEISREEIQGKKIISNPGCLATAAILAVAPFAALASGDDIILNLATGSSGSGKEPKATTHHPVRHSNFYAYKPLVHQHLPEIEDALSKIGLQKSGLKFVPHSLPVSRGILCTAYMTLKKELPLASAIAHAEAFYENSRFIRITGAQPAELENVVGSNFCDVSIAVQGKTIVVHSAIDNLVKGMAGQAIQNMNIAIGVHEISGLWFPATRPV